MNRHRGIQRVSPETGLSTKLAEKQQLEEFVEASRAPNSVRAYESDIRHFEAWCSSEGRQHFPASVETVCVYFNALARGSAGHDPSVPPKGNLVSDGGWHVSSILRKKSSIGRMHRLAGISDPTKDERTLTVLKGIRRAAGRKVNAKEPLLPEDVRDTLDELPDSLLNLRNKAIVLVGMSTGLRRSNIAALDAEDVRFVRQGAEITVRKSKTDQEGEGQILGVPHQDNESCCPVVALKAWMKAARIKSGALFVRLIDGKHPGKRINGNEIAAIVKQFASLAGKDPDAYAGHSLRAGFVTDAAIRQQSMFSIMAQTGHRKFETVQRYVRNANRFNANAASGMFAKKKGGENGQ